jgi:hypothetical protein
MVHIIPIQIKIYINIVDFKDTKDIKDYHQNER